MTKRFLIMAVLALAVVALASCSKSKPEASAPTKATTQAPTPAPAPPPEKAGPPAVVSLKYDSAAKPCVALDPPTPVTIYVSTKGPHNITWKKQDESEEYEWVIDQKGKDGGPGSLGGKTTFTIPCNGKQIPSANATKDGDWNYSVTVKNCEKGQPKETLCQIDPKIIILP